jgi:hypothetical protein
MKQKRTRVILERIEIGLKVSSAFIIASIIIVGCLYNIYMVIKEHHIDTFIMTYWIDVVGLMFTFFFISLVMYIIGCLFDPEWWKNEAFKGNGNHG